MIITRENISLLEMMVQAFKNGEPITVVEDSWLKSTEALKVLGLRTPDYLKWLHEEGHINRRQRDGRSFEYEPISLKEAANMIESKTIVLPKLGKA